MNEDFIKYLGEVKIKLGLTSDRQFAVKLGVTQSYVSQMMSAGQVPNDDICVRIAELVNDDPRKVILLAHKCKSSYVSRPYWEQLEQLFKLLPKGAITASLALLIVMPALADFSLHNATQYILCDIGFGL